MKKWLLSVQQRELTGSSQSRPTEWEMLVHLIADMVLWVPNNFLGMSCLIKENLQQLWKGISYSRTLRLIGSLSNVLRGRVSNILNWACQDTACTDWSLLESKRNNVHLMCYLERGLRLAVTFCEVAHSLKGMMTR